MTEISSVGNTLLSENLLNDHSPIKKMKASNYLPQLLALPLTTVKYAGIFISGSVYSSLQLPLF